MASNQKDVKIKIATEEDLKGAKAIEHEVLQLRQQKIQLDIQTNTSRLEEVKSRIETVKSELKILQGKADVDDSEVKRLESELASLESEKIDLQLNTAQAKLELSELDSEIKRLENNEVEINLRNQSAMEAVDQISQGFDRLKQGAGEVAEEMGVILDQAGQAEQNQAFLKIGFDKAGSKNAEQDAITAQKKIQDIVASAPGDDVAMNSILSSAVAKDVSLMDKDMQGFANSVSDYFAGAEVNGKLAAEAIQDVRSYINSGNVAELETTGIFNQEQLDQLKNIDSVGERVAKFQEMVNQSAYAGLGTADTLTNKFAEFDGMMAQSQTRLGGLFSEGTKGALDFVLKLNDASGGLLGMGLAAASFASPLTDTLMGLGQMATGLKAIKDLGMISYLGQLGSAFSSLGSFLIANPIILVVVAIVALVAALVWAYYNVDWFREMVDNAWQSLQAFASYLYGEVIGGLEWLGQMFNNTGQIMQTAITGAVDWIISSLQGLWTYITTFGGLLPQQVSITGNQVVDGILAVMAFMATLPMQIGIIFVNIIAKALGFGDNFVQTLVSGATRAVSGFIGKIRDGVNQFTSAIQGIKTALQNCLDWAYNMVMSHPIVQALQWLGEQAVNAFSVLGLGQGSPGDIYGAIDDELKWTKERVQKEDGIQNVAANLGKNITDSFQPAFGIDFEDTANAQLTTLASEGNTPQTINLTMEIGSVDNEDRVQEIIDAIRKELNWNNITAGRASDL